MCVFLCTVFESDFYVLCSNLTSLIEQYWKYNFKTHLQEQFCLELFDALGSTIHTSDESKNNCV